jgi:4-hydroxy-tetrahydrodipicolinate reductase
LTEEKVIVSSSPILSVGVHGALGRMGRRLIELIAQDPSLRLGAALVSERNPNLGQDANVMVGLAAAGVSVCHLLPDPAAIDVMIDFSLPAAAVSAAECCRRRNIPLVIGTTGFTPDQRRELVAASATFPLLIAPNMSRAVNLLMKLVDTAARALGDSADIAIVERHHRTKKDAPSGTALRLAEMAGRGQASARLVPADSGAGTGTLQPAREISIHALRLADSPGEHVVVFGLMGETLELSHRAINRDGFVRGALDAAKFLAGKPAGLFTIEDALGC